MLGIGATQRRVLEYLQNLNNDTATSIPTRITLIDGTHAETPATALLEARFRTAGARGGAGLSGDGGSTGPDGKDSPIAIAVWEYTFLLAPWLLPAATRRVIYVETDSWFLASPVGLWNHGLGGGSGGGDGVAVGWGAAKSTGIMLLGLPALRNALWPVAAKAWCAATKSGWRAAAEASVEGPGGDRAGGARGVGRAQIVLRALDRVRDMASFARSLARSLFAPAI